MHRMPRFREGRNTQVPISQRSDALVVKALSLPGQIGLAHGAAFFALVVGEVVLCVLEENQLQTCDHLTVDSATLSTLVYRRLALE